MATRTDDDPDLLTVVASKLEDLPAIGSEGLVIQRLERIR
jgi:hypothetical protein